MEGLVQGKQVHAHVIQSGFKPSIFLHNSSINMYSKCVSIMDARQVFERMPDRDISTWNMMIAGYAKHGYGREAFKMYELMQQEGVTPNGVTFICILKACASIGSLDKGKEVHADIVKAHIAPDIIMETALADMYAKCGSLKDARQVFDKMAKRNVVSWSAMIAGYAQHGCGKEAVEMYQQMQREGVRPNRVTFICVLKGCASLGDVKKGKEVHADISKSGIVPDIILENILVDMYAKCRSMKRAYQVFDNMSRRDVVSWSAMIAGYAQQGCGREAFELYEQMISEGIKPNKVTFICVLNACASLGALEKGKVLHADIVKAGIVSYVNLENTLVDMYAKCRSMKDACQVFDNMSQRDVVSWNAMIGGYTENGCGTEAFKMYGKMQQEGVVPNRATFVSLLKACAGLGALEEGKAVHADVSKSGIAPDIILGGALADMYAKCGSMKAAHQVFDNMAQRNVVSWNLMIAGYAQHGCGWEALQLYEQMQVEGVMPDMVTFNGLVNACASLGTLEKGRKVHADIIKAGIIPDFILETALVDMYAKCGSLKDARQVFDNMAQQDAVSWSAMLTGYAQHGYNKEAIDIYEQMIREGVKPNKVVFICILNMCASLAALEKGIEIHAAVIQAGIDTDMFLETALVVMYAKCGSMEDACQVFYNMAVRDVVSWNAIIVGYAQHGYGREALHVFEQMQQEGFSPNGITFVCLLLACNHGGLLDEGQHYFDSMSRDHGLNATVEHYGCMVDLFGRAGLLNEAENVVNNMPIEPGAAVWGALLGACRTRGDVERAEHAAKFLLICDHSMSRH